MLKFKRGQSILEFAVLVALIISALVVMQVYIKRSYQGRIKRETDSLGQQYSPGHTTGRTIIETTSDSVAYTGGTTDPDDMPGLITGEVEVDAGTSVTVSRSDTRVSSDERVDSLASERLYERP